MRKEENCLNIASNKIELYFYAGIKAMKENVEIELIDNPLSAFLLKKRKIMREEKKTFSRH